MTSTWRDFVYGTITTEIKYASEVIFTKDTPYLALTGKLWGVFCEDLGENWLRYDSTALYIKHFLACTNGWLQDCGISAANSLTIPRPCTKPSYKISWHVKWSDSKQLFHTLQPKSLGISHSWTTSRAGGFRPTPPLLATVVGRFLRIDCCGGRCLEFC